MASPASRRAADPAGLQEELSSRSAAELAALLRLRPDLARAAPASAARLAQLASTRASLHRAALGLERPELDALEQAILLGPDQAAQAPGFEGLRARALILRGPGSGGRKPSADDAATWLLAPGAEHMLGRYPAGMGRPAAELRAQLPEPGRPPQLAAGAPVDLGAVPAEVRAVLERFAAHPLGSLRDARRHLDPEAPSSRPIDWLLARGMLMAVDDRHVEAPLEVGLALRPDPWSERPRTIPLPDGRRVPVRLRDNAAAAAAAEIVRRLREVRAELRDRPLDPLRAGGIGVRERRRLAAALDLEVSEADRLLGFAQLSGLVTQGDDDSWHPSSAPFEALEDPAALGHVIACWWDADLVPSAVGTARPDGSVVAPLTGDLALEDAQILREAVAEALRAHGDAAPSEDALAETAAWLRPRLGAAVRARASGIARECADLGLTGAGAGTDLLGLLLDEGPEAVARALADRLDRPVETVVLQDDMTASARGPLSPGARDELGLLAEPEGRGAAATLRITQASLHRAMDAGHDAASLEELLERRSETGVPGVVREAVREAARTHGSLRTLRADQVLTGRADLIEAIASSAALKGIETVRVAAEVLVLREPHAARQSGGAVAAALRRAARAVGVQPAPERPARPAAQPVDAAEPGDLALLFPVPPPRRPRADPREIEALARRLAGDPDETEEAPRG